MRRSGLQLLALLVGSISCSTSNDSNGTGDVSSGGGASSTVGGRSTTGGATGGSGGSSPQAGGSSVAGGQSSSAGGNDAQGGETNGGGASASGGSATGGTSSTGGGAQGGASATGGKSSKTSNTGGSATGGASAAGGKTSATGGKSSSPPSSGGTAKGGAGATGGESSAGQSSSGGTTVIASTSVGGGGASGGGGSGGTSATGGTAATGGQTSCPSLPTSTLASNEIIQFNDNGGWCWYQDERAVVDTKGGKFVIGSVASGGSRGSDQEVVIYDIASGNKQRYTLQSDLNVDDHNAPAFTVLPDGTYSAIWATHRDNCYSYYSVFNGSSWSAYKRYDWAANGCPWDKELNPSPAHMVTYSNPWYLSAEDKIFNAARTVSTSPAMLQSNDGGNSWSFYGRLTSTATVGYVAGYYKYWGNGVDRIDFVATEAHPRDNNNNLWHGYYKGGKLYNSADVVVDSNAGDTSAQDVSKFTKVFATGTSLNGTPLCRMWNHDIVRYADGTIAITGQGRANNCSSTPSDSDPDKRFFYSRWDGSTWKTTYLVKGGPKLYSSEQDYTGLSALHPDNPNVIFVSTTVDPRDDKTTFPHHEIFMGVTCDNGATWEWAPLTSNSTVENIRPIVPKWDADHTLLLWLKGTYTSAQSYSTQVVGTTALSAVKP